MHPTVKKVVALGERLNLSNNKLAEHMGVAPSSLQGWRYEGREITEKTLPRLRRFIERVEAGETFEPKPKPKPRPVSLDKIPNRVRVMYELIYKLEDKYGRLFDADENDPMLELLRKEANA